MCVGQSLFLCYLKYHLNYCNIFILQHFTFYYQVTINISLLHILSVRNVNIIYIYITFV